MDRVDIAGAGVVIVYTAVVILALAGWVGNIVKFAGCDFKSPYKAEVIRGVGIIVPVVGAVTGYLDIEDGPIIEKDK